MKPGYVEEEKRKNGRTAEPSVNVNELEDIFKIEVAVPVQRGKILRPRS
ncbi:MAG TPA: hypothetical protein VFD24_02205 [Chitinophagaceae bacterium]|nr:hypothetical protein [Chitinophagaceae bacterium]